MVIGISNLSPSVSNNTTSTKANPVLGKVKKWKDKIVDYFSTLSQATHLQPKTSFRKKFSNTNFSKSYLSTFNTPYNIEIKSLRLDTKQAVNYINDNLLKLALIRSTSTNGHADAALNQVHLNYDGQLCQSEFAYITFVYDQINQCMYLKPGPMQSDAIYLNGIETAVLTSELNQSPAYRLGTGLNKIIFSHIKLTIQMTPKVK